MNNLRITTEQLARICGVSQGTVDRALNDRPGISRKTKEKVLEAAKNYGWRQSSGNTKEAFHTPIVGIIVFDLNNDFFARLITDFEEIAHSKGIFTTILFTHYDQAAEVECLRWLDSCGADAAVLCSVNSGQIFENFLAELSMPIIAIGNKTANIPYVGIDDFAAMKAAARHLFSLYRMVIYFSPAMRYPNAFAQRKRFEGFMSEAANNAQYSVITSIDNILPEYPSDTAILCSTDYYAMQVYTHTSNVKIMGFDNLSMIDKLKLPIDSVDYDTSLIAKEVFMLIETGQQHDIIIPYSLVLR